MSEMIYHDHWGKRGCFDFELLYSGPRMDLEFGYNIMHGRYDNTMDPDILAYYKKYFTEHPDETMGIFEKNGWERLVIKDLEPEVYLDQNTGDIYTIEIGKILKNGKEI